MTFFICVAQFAEELTNGIGVRPNLRCVKKGCTQLRHGDVTILRDDFGKEVSMRIQFAPAFWAALPSSFRPARPPDCKSPSRSCGRRELQAQCCRTPA
jgi:hypothetical protein